MNYFSEFCFRFQTIQCLKMETKVSIEWFSKKSTSVRFSRTWLSQFRSCYSLAWPGQIKSNWFDIRFGQVKLGRVQIRSGKVNSHDGLWTSSHDNLFDSHNARKWSLMKAFVHFLHGSSIPLGSDPWPVCPLPSQVVEPFWERALIFLSSSSRGRRTPWEAIYLSTSFKGRRSPWEVILWWRSWSTSLAAAPSSRRPVRCFPNSIARKTKKKWMNQWWISDAPSSV